MKKRRSCILSLLLALCLIAGLACVPAAAEESGAPSLEISQSEFDLGTHSPSKVGASVSYSPPRDYKFDLTNTGDTPVVIQSFEISSTADIAGDPYRHNIQLEVSSLTRENRLAPGESRPMSLDAKLSVNQETTDSGEFTGTAALRVTVEAPETGETTVMEFPLTFTYEYLPAFEISQTEFDLGQISTDEFRDLQEYITGYQAFERLHGSEYVTMVNYTDSEFTNGYGGGVFTGEGNNYITPSGDYQMHVDLGLPGGLAPSLDSGEEGEVRISWELYYIGDEAKAPDTASLPTGKYTVHVEPTFRENDDSFDVIHHSIPMTFTFEIVPGTAQTEEPEDPEEEKPQYDFSVSPKELDFGELERNETVPDRTVTITNTGSKRLEVTVRFPMYGPGITKKTLEPGASMSVQIAPDPGLGAVGEHEDSLHILTRQGNLEYDLPIRYTILAGSRLSAESDNLDFGTMESGGEQPDAKTVRVRNTGDLNITFEQPDAQYFTVEIPSGFQKLPPELFADMVVRPKADLAPGDYEETITVRTEDGASASFTAAVTVTGEGGEVPTEQPSPWAVEQVSAAIEAGLVPESLQSKYTQTATRAEFCALAVELYETVTGKEITQRATFSDTSDVNVQKMAGIGVINGIGGNKFNPNGELTREQAATILVRLADALGRPLPEGTAAFSDNASISSWALESVGRAKAGGIMDGIGNNTFSPQGAYTREQSIMTAYRLFETVG